MTITTQQNKAEYGCRRGGTWGAKVTCCLSVYYSCLCIYVNMYNVCMHVYSWSIISRELNAVLFVGHVQAILLRAVRLLHGVCYHTDSDLYGALPGDHPPDVEQATNEYVSSWRRCRYRVAYCYHLQFTYSSRLRHR